MYIKLDEYRKKYAFNHNTPAQEIIPNIISLLPRLKVRSAFSFNPKLKMFSSSLSQKLLALCAFGSVARAAYDCVQQRNSEVTWNGTTSSALAAFLQEQVAPICTSGALGSAASWPQGTTQGTNAYQ